MIFPAGMGEAILWVWSLAGFRVTPSTTAEKTPFPLPGMVLKVMPAMASSFIGMMRCMPISHFFMSWEVRQVNSLPRRTMRSQRCSLFRPKVDWRPRSVVAEVRTASEAAAHGMEDGYFIVIVGGTGHLAHHVPTQQSPPGSRDLSLKELMWAVSMKSPLIFLLTRYSPSPTKRKHSPCR